MSEREQQLMVIIMKQDSLFEKLDEAMATPEMIARDTRYVGGFVSGLNLTYTAEEIVERAIARIKKQSE